MNKRSQLLRRLLAGLVLTGLVIAIAVRQNELARLRRDNAGSLAESAEAQRLSSDNQELATLRAGKAEIQKLRQENEDLPRLRNEVRQLRRQTEELAKLRSENQRLLAQNAPAGAAVPQAPIARPEGFIAAEALTDMGLSTPAAAVQTMFCAILRRNINRLLGCLYQAPDEDPLTAETMGSPPFGDLTPERFPGFGIVSQKDVSPNEVTVGLQTTVQGSILPMSVIRVGSEWKVKLH